MFPGGIRIGGLAGLVGISTQAVRHYHHRVGLLPEPARKANGYREYSLRDAVELARVRRLTELGLSLDEVGDAPAGNAGRDLVEILRELDADLARQEADLRRRQAQDRDLLALLETASSARGTGWLDVFTRALNSDPEAVEKTYRVYARLDELAGSPADDPRVEATAHVIVAATPEPARQAIRFPNGDLEETDDPSWLTLVRTLYAHEQGPLNG